MHILLLVFLALLPAHQESSQQGVIQASVRVSAANQLLTVAVTLAPHADNMGVQVAVTALTGRPESWAADTVYHQWILEDGATTDGFDDTWGHMPPGRYRINVSLQRNDKEYAVPPMEAEIARSGR